MPLTWSTVLQILTVLSTAIGELTPLVTSPRGKVALATAGGLITVILHNYAGSRNPDGTPAAMPYVPQSRSKG